MRKKIERNKLLVGRKALKSKSDANQLILSMEKWNDELPHELNEMCWFEFMSGSSVFCIERDFDTYVLSDQSMDMTMKSTNILCTWDDRGFFRPSIKKLIDYIYDERKSINKSIKIANQ